MLVSVIIPTYNRAKTISAAVTSVMEQTYNSLEVIVVDDGSEDDTEDVLRSFAGRIRLIRQQNAGPSAARNRGVAASKGEIVAFLDSDDYWMPDKIARQVALMERVGKSMCCCVCNALAKNESGDTQGSTFAMAGIRPGFAEGTWTNPDEVLATRFLLFNQVVAIRRTVFDQLGGFNESLSLLEDYELSLRLSVAGTWGVIADPLVIKHNDTNGIGVKCMADPERHAQIRFKVISGILARDSGLSIGARDNLQQSLDELKNEINAISMIKHGDLISKFRGRALHYVLRARRSVRRRRPSWPQFQGSPDIL